MKKIKYEIVLDTKTPTNDVFKFNFQLNEMVLWNGNDGIFETEDIDQAKNAMRQENSKEGECPVKIEVWAHSYYEDGEYNEGKLIKEITKDDLD